MKHVSLWAFAAALGAVPGAPALAQDSAYLSANLFGTSVPGGSGVEDATGDFNGEVDFAKGQICYYLDYEGLTGADAANIYQAEDGKNGPAVVPLPLAGTAGDEVCAPVDKAVLDAIAKAPKDYYVAVRTPSHPDGAIRGQLGG